MLHPIIKPCPFRGWGLDFVGEIHPSSSKGHQFVLDATNYFTKWTKAVLLKKYDSQGGHELHDGTHYTSIWFVANIDGPSKGCFYVSSI
jgi:hypothetical protein